MADLLDDVLALAGNTSERQIRVIARSAGAMLATTPNYGEVQEALALIQRMMPSEDATRSQLRVVAGLLRGYQDGRLDAKRPPPAPLRERVMQVLSIGTRTPTAISQLTRSPSSSIGRVLRELRDEGLVQVVEQNTTDRRMRAYALTDAGRLQVTDDGRHRAITSVLGASDSGLIEKVRDTLSGVQEARRLNRLDGDGLANLLALSNVERLPPELRADCFGEIVTISRQLPNLADERLGWKYLDSLLGLGLSNGYVAARAYYELARWKICGRQSSQPETIADALEIARTSAEESGNRAVRGWCHYTQALVRDGENASVDEVCGELQHARDNFKCISDWYGYITCGLLEAKTYLRAGRLIEAINALEECREKAESSGRLSHEADAGLWLSEAHLARGDARRALNSSFHAAEKYRESGQRNRTWVALGVAQTAKLASMIQEDASLSEQQRRVAIERIDRSIGNLSKSETHGWWLGVIHHRRGILERTFGDFERAAKDLKVAIDIFDKEKGHQGLVPSLSSFAEVELAAGPMSRSFVSLDVQERMVRAIDSLPETIPTAIVSCTAPIYLVINKDRGGAKEHSGEVDIVEEMGWIYSCGDLKR